MNDVYMASFFQAHDCLCVRAGSDFGQDMDPSADGYEGALIDSQRRRIRRDWGDFSAAVSSAARDIEGQV